MKITLIPIRSDANFTLAMKDSRLTIDGIALAQLPPELSCWVLEADATSASIIVPYCSRVGNAPVKVTLQVQADGPVRHPDI